MYSKLILMLLLLSMPVQADEVIIVDTTEGYSHIAYLYTDGEYTDVYNISGQEKLTIGANNYDLLINPSYDMILSDPSSDNFVRYMFYSMRYYIFGFIFIIILMVITWEIYRR